MPTFNLIISDEPFDHRTRGAAPFVETVEHGANGNISTPATEAYTRCLDLIADLSAADAQPDDEFPLRRYLDSLAEPLENDIDTLNHVTADDLRREFAIRDDGESEQLVSNVYEFIACLRLAVKSLTKIASWPKPKEANA